MSAGTVHRKASIILAVALILQGLLMLDFGGVYRAIGSLLGIVATPDWDVDAGMIMDKTIRNKMGWFAEYLWDGFLYWYRKSLKHGSPLSHFPVVGTMGRILYSFLLIIIIPHAVVYIIFSPSWDFMFVISWYWKQIMERENITYGLMASDFIHWGLDIATTEHKETKNKTA